LWHFDIGSVQLCKKKDITALFFNTPAETAASGYRSDTRKIQGISQILLNNHADSPRGSGGVKLRIRSGFPVINPPQKALRLKVP
jgi:hypothetical protein